TQQMSALQRIAPPGASKVHDDPRPQVVIQVKLALIAIPPQSCDGGIRIGLQSELPDLSEFVACPAKCREHAFHVDGDRLQPDVEAKAEERRRGTAGTLFP